MRSYYVHGTEMNKEADEHGKLVQGARFHHANPFKESDAGKYASHDFKLGAEWERKNIAKKLPWITCIGCEQNEVCKFAFDRYNTDGDCLAEKIKEKA